MFCKNCGKKVKTLSRFCKNCGHELVAVHPNSSKTKKWLWFLSAILVVVIFIFIYKNYFNNNVITLTKDTQDKIAETVVNIYCESNNPKYESSRGSGTILHEDGIILTNSHIIPQDKNTIYVNESGCLVTIPDATTGQRKEIYWATPYSFPELSDNYDLAYLIVQSPYQDEKTKQLYGTYPKKFPVFDDSLVCPTYQVKLGEQVRIFGYPSISGGLDLTITDGIVSSIQDGIVMTSANVSHGNSGGLAVNKDGCMIGVPSMVSSDDNTSLGLIITMDKINEFSEKVSELLNEQEE